MEIRRAEILDKIFDWLPNSEGFITKIKPILISKDSKGDFNPIALLNRFAYTIVDQQRDVESIIIPIWNTMLYYGMNQDFLTDSTYASEFVSSIFQAFGHQQYHTKKQIKLQGKRMGSRTDAFLKCYRERNANEFRDLLVEKQEEQLCMT